MKKKKKRTQVIPNQMLNGGLPGEEIFTTVLESLPKAEGLLPNPMIENLRQQILQEQKRVNDWKNTAEPLLWTLKDMILPLFCSFMQFNKSIVRFSKVFDQDPCYYLGRVREQFPLWSKLYLGNRPGYHHLYKGETLREYISAYKAFAVHFSEREKDLDQLRRFYRKQMPFLEPLTKTTFNKEEPVILEQVLRNLIVMIGKDEANRIGESIGVGVIAYLLFHQIPVQVGKPMTNPCLGIVFDDYMDTVFSLPPNPVKSINSQDMISSMASDYLTRSSSYIGKLISCFICSTHGSSPYAIQVWKLLREQGEKDSIPQEDLDYDEKNISYIRCEIDWKTNLLRKLVFYQLEQEAKTHEICTTSVKPQNTKEEQKKVLDNQDVIFQAELTAKKYELEQMKVKIDNLQHLLKCQKEETQRLKEAARALEEEKKSLQISLNNMEELLSCIENEDNNNELPEADLALIKRSKVVVVGGHDRVQQLILERCPNIRTIGAERSQLDANLIRNADLICFLPQHLSHSIFDNVKRIATLSKIPFVYQTGNNINFILSKISEKLKTESCA